MSLVEVLIAGGMLAISALAIFQMTIYLGKSGKQEEQRAKQYIVLIEILKNLEKDDPWVPPQPPDTSFSNAAHANRIIQRCYDEDGSPMGAAVLFTDASCYFKVKAFKIGVRDENYKANTLPDGNLPISRYSVQVRFPYLGGEKTQEMSFFKTNYARF
ncbi:MAG: hypothetical protein KGQ59_03795 [Bdellovibrionales bacterium]|nr:hypothetical protein [Bdellovibrionales bacterium]